MFPLTMQSGSAGCGDALAQAILHQRLGVASRMSVQQAREGGMHHQSMISTSLSSLTLPRGLSPSEVMQTASLQDRERLLSSELLKHREEQLVTALALASRNQVLSKQQQDQNEDLILKRAIRVSSFMEQGSHSRSPALAIDNGPVYCAEQDLSLEKDICFGRGQRVQRRKANVAFRKIVATHQETYDQAESREDKKFVVKKVARIFSRAGYRFFKETDHQVRFGNRSKIWVAVANHHVEYKIGHSFRSGRKQLKQQKNQVNDKLDIDATNTSVCNEVEPKTITPSIEVKPRASYEEVELSEKCICIGDKREKYTSKEAYQYFRGFILTFKSILAMTNSVPEKTKVVSGLIEQIKATKGYKFLKLQHKRDVDFLVEASAEEISSEIFSIIGDQANQDKEKAAYLAEQTNRKRSLETNDDAPQKRQCVSSDNICPDALERLVSDNASTSKDNKEVSSCSTSEKREKFIWKKGRKRTLPEGVKKFTSVPSEIIYKPKIGQAIAPTRAVSNQGTSAFSKIHRDSLSVISSQGIRIPPSLISPDVVLGQAPIGKNSPGALEQSLEMLRGTRSHGSTVSAVKNTGDPSILEKALLAMQPSSFHHEGGRSIGRTNANLATENKIGIHKKLMQHLREQELLLFEKKRKLALLELQMQARNGGVQ